MWYKTDAQIVKIQSSYLMTISERQLDVMYDALSRYEGKCAILNTHDKVVQNARDIVEADELANLMRTV